MKEEPTTSPILKTYEGFCVKCKAKRTFEGQEHETPKGRVMAKGHCPVCGSGMGRILGKIRTKTPA